MNKALVLFLVAAGVLLGTSAAYKPVIMLHGFTGSYKDYDSFIKFINKYHPGQETHSLKVDDGVLSMRNLRKQINDVVKAINKLIDSNPANFSDGFHLIGHSQGGIITRAIIMENEFNVHNYISLAGVQAGFYGDCNEWFSGNKTCIEVTKLMYTDEMRNSLSAASYWRSPDRETYINGNKFLPVLDNELEYNATKKTNFLRPQGLYFFGSPDDEIIKPWRTSIFDFWDDNMQTIPMESMPFYIDDTFGLRTALETKKAHRTAVDGVFHQGWIEREDIFTDYLMDLLV